MMQVLPKLLVLIPVSAVVRPDAVSAAEVQRQLQEIDLTKLPLRRALSKSKFDGIRDKEEDDEQQKVISLKMKKEFAAGRRLSQETKCMATTDCGDNEYCMHCAKCKAYGLSLPESTRRWWSCAPCQSDDTGAFCENGRYCPDANDAVEDACPAQFKGCNRHSQCGADEYCFSCAECEKARAGNSWANCKPCPTSLGGYCQSLTWCGEMNDSIDGQCPRFHGCDSHAACSSGMYCESCSKCKAYMTSLGERGRSTWSCYPCDTVLGGICEQERFCQLANDSIDGSCPVSSACSKNSDCARDKYCMGCAKCQEYRDSIPNPEMWTCQPCPTEQGGACEIGKFCSVANDSIEGVCPEYHGCGRNSDCTGSGMFCLKYEACTAELGLTECGERPSNGGFCIGNEYCTPERSISGSCLHTLSGCSHHLECNSNEFCTSWKECKALRGTGFCGNEPTNIGICLGVEQCKLGLHSPIDARCPVLNSATHPRLTTREVVRHNGTLNLATFRQAMNVWLYDDGKSEPQERVIMQLHDFGGPDSRHDDLEFFSSSLVQNGQFIEEWREQTSCPSVEIIVPHYGPYVYEARSAKSLAELDMAHHDCSCLTGNFSWSTPGVCPRGVRFSASAPQRVHVVAFTDINQFVLPTNHTLYSIVNETSALAVSVDQDACPKQNDDAGTPYAWTTGCKQLLDDGKTIAGVSGKWCMVAAGGCSLTLKYKMCWASGAAGFVLVADEDNKSDLMEIVMLLDDPTLECGELIPAVIVQGIDNTAKAALAAGTMEIAVGPEIPLAVPRPNHGLSSGGLRVFDTKQRKWVKHFEVFGGVQYVESSPIRDVLFVCASNSSFEQNTLRIFDVSLYAMESTSQGGRCEFQDSVDVLYGEFTQKHCKEICLADRRCMAVNMSLGAGMGADTKVLCIGVRSKVDADPTKITFSRVTESGSVGASGGTNLVLSCFQKIPSPEPGPRLVEILGNVTPKCRRGDRRDYHIVDFAQGSSFYTTLVDPEDSNNQLYIYETTNLNQWRLLQTIHANWEDEKSGLGQVVGNAKGDRHVITWHCSNIYCSGSFGHSAYILDTSTPADIVSIERSLALPMKEGTFARDVGCNSNELCIVTLNHDGLVLIDLASGNGPEIIASHSETFNSDHIPVPVYRMFSGAQKVYPSKKDANIFYVESSTLDWGMLVDGTSLARAINFDAVYMVKIEPSYTRDSSIFPMLVDPVVLAHLDVGKTWQEIQNMLPESGLGNDESVFEQFVIQSFGTALRLPPTRFKALTLQFKPTNVEMTFNILPGPEGPSPLTIFQMLTRQIGAAHSAIHDTRLGPLVESLTLTRLSANRFPYKDVEGQTEIRYVGHDQVLVLSVGIGFSIVFVIGAFVMAYRKHKKLQELKEEMLSRGTNFMQSPIRSQSIISGQPASGYVIGRPAVDGNRSLGGKGDSNMDSDNEMDDLPGISKETPEADNIEVVGEPVERNIPATNARVPGRRRSVT